MAGILKNFPDEQSGTSSTENTVTITISDETENSITTRVVHDNPSVEGGYASLYMKVVGNASDSIAPKIKYYGGSSVGDTSSYTLIDPDGNTTVTPGASGTTKMFHLNRQKHWGMNNGFKITFTKTGTNAACTIYWRVIYR